MSIVIKNKSRLISQEEFDNVLRTALYPNLVLEMREIERVVRNFNIVYLKSNISSNAIHRRINKSIDIGLLVVSKKTDRIGHRRFSNENNYMDKISFPCTWACKLNSSTVTEISLLRSGELKKYE